MNEQFSFVVSFIYFRIFYIPARGGHLWAAIFVFIAISFCHVRKRDIKPRVFGFAFFFCYLSDLSPTVLSICVLRVCVFFVLRFCLALLLPVGWSLYSRYFYSILLPNIFYTFALSFDQGTPL